jgi:hypothetical protein
MTCVGGHSWTTGRVCRKCGIPEEMTNKIDADNWRYEITLEPDQKCVKPRLKLREGFDFKAVAHDIENAVVLFHTIRGTLIREGFTVAPLREDQK